MTILIIADSPRTEQDFMFLKELFREIQRLNQGQSQPIKIEYKSVYASEAERMLALKAAYENVQVLSDKTTISASKAIDDSSRPYRSNAPLTSSVTKSADIR
jgi:hypothetical protein